MTGKAKTVMSRRYLALVKALNNRLDHFPAHEQRSLALVIRNKLYSLCDWTVEGQKRYHKKTAINSLDIAHEQLRMHLFTAYQLGYFSNPIPRSTPKNLSKEELQAVRDELNFDRFKKLTVLVDEFGEIIGGWKNSLDPGKDKKTGQIVAEDQGGQPSNN